MKCIVRIGAGLVVLTAAALVLAPVSVAQGPPYDLKSEVVLSGKVAAVRAVPDWMGKDGVNVSLQTEQEALVHVDTAPDSFLKMLDFPIAAGDDLEIKGTYARVNGERVFLAHQLHIRKVTVSIRDPRGNPLW